MTRSGSNHRRPKSALPPSPSLDEILAQRPAVAIIDAVPSDRALLADQAVAAGAAVLVDKPLALSHAALDHLIRSVQKHKKPIITYYAYRGYPQVRAAKEALERRSDREIGAGHVLRAAQNQRDVAPGLALVARAKRRGPHRHRLAPYGCLLLDGRPCPGLDQRPARQLHPT